MTLMPACKKWLEQQKTSQQDRVQVFGNDSTADAAAQNMFVAMVSGMSFSNGLLSKAAGLLTDELVPYARLPASSADSLFYYGQLTADNAQVEGLWSSCWAIQYNANALLEGIPVSKGVSDSVGRVLMGEAWFVRAFNNFYCVNLFGEIPLLLTTDYAANRSLTRAPVAEVYRQIVDDLQRALLVLPPVRQRTALDELGNTRPTKWAAMALLARVCAFRGDWAACAHYASEVLASGQFGLEPNPVVSFRRHSRETIFQLQTAGNPGHAAPEAQLFLPGPGGPACVYPPELLNTIARGDQRKDRLMGIYRQGRDSFYYPAKYKTRPSPQAAEEYAVVLRLAELYLLRAEALAQLAPGTVPAPSLADLSVIRQRAGLRPVVAANVQELMAAIEGEWRIEFLAEYGHRFLQLKRWPGRANKNISRLEELMSSARRDRWKPHFDRWPLPRKQVDLNAGWQQNPGY